MEIIVGVAGFV